jgi:VWFA-related protein
MAGSESISLLMNLAKMAVVGATRWLCVVGFATCLSGAAVAAQDKSTSAAAETVEDDSTPTLHVYRSLLQVPVLVLRTNGDRLKTPISDTRFSVSLDSGPWFPATHVRPEGDDPITLSILLDLNGDGRSLMSKMVEAIANLAPKSLGPQDHVSVYALGCSLISGASDLPADSAALKRAVNGVLSSSTERNNKKQVTEVSDCGQKEHLWDALAKLTEGLHKLPGRRVMLVISDGNDDGSAHTRNQVIEGAQAASVAIFGFKSSPDTTSTSTENPLQSRGEYGISTETAQPAELDKANPFRNLCELTGGAARLASPRTLKDRLKGFTAMVRERYIVEFPRPLNGKSGWHEITVRIDQGNYFVRTAGITFPLMSPAVLADPTTVPSNPSLAPSFGSRSPIRSPQ